MRSAEDRTARARIRDAAIAAVARRGAKATTVREVAAAAGVSPGLVLHHFGSKRGLMDACDEAVLAVFLQALSENNTGINDLLAQKQRNAEWGPFVAYVVRALRDGGAFAHRVFSALVDQVERYLRSAVDDGVVRPARDEHVRAQMVTTYSMGAAMLGEYVIGEGIDPIDVSTRLTDLFTPEGLDLYTDGLFTDSRFRDAMLAAERPSPTDQSNDPPSTSAKGTS